MDLAPIKARLKAATPGGWRRGKGIGLARTDTIYGGDRGGNVVAWGVGNDGDADLIASAPADIAALVAEVERLVAERDHPETADFLAGVAREVAHQRARWGANHDATKTPEDWFWLIGYLVGKALHKPEKRLHHLVTAAAALCNWHRYTKAAEGEAPR